MPRSATNGPEIIQANRAAGRRRPDRDRRDRGRRRHPPVPAQRGRAAGDDQPEGRGRAGRPRARRSDAGDLLELPGDLQEEPARDEPRDPRTVLEPGRRVLPVPAGQARDPGPARPGHLRDLQVVRPQRHGRLSARRAVPRQPGRSVVAEAHGAVPGLAGGRARGLPQHRPRRGRQGRGDDAAREQHRLHEGVPEVGHVHHRGPAEVHHRPARGHRRPGRVRGPRRRRTG